MADKIPHNALVVVADGTGAQFFRNSGREHTVSLTADGELQPAHLENDGPSGKRPQESTRQETDEATFAKQLANELYRRGERDQISGECRSLLVRPSRTLPTSYARR